MSETEPNDMTEMSHQEGDASAPAESDAGPPAPQPVQQAAQQPVQQAVQQAGGTGSPIDVETELDRFRKRLLDLTTRNSLLSYRKSRRRSLQIIDELPNHVFTHLVGKGNRFKFLAAEEAQEEQEQERDQDQTPEADAPETQDTGLELPREPEDPTMRLARHRDDRLQTLEDADTLERKLKIIRSDANAVIDETGANHLYLAIGLLEWSDTRSAEDSHLAPLILIPVTLERDFEARTQRWRFTIHHTGEELQSNLSLQVKLDEDFGLKLPDFEDGIEPETYFDSVERVISSQQHWNIRREAVLGFFSFTKFLMYRDLAPTNWPAEHALGDNAQLRAIFEGGEIEDVQGLFADDYDIDARSGDELMLAIDADSSQHSALIDVASGKSLVIEGPPGTGKSQTITNIIAWALGEQKTVLFVAEKLAALEVVRKNLDRVGLGDLCLELHSRKAKPAEVYRDLGVRLEKKFPRAGQLSTRRQRLNAEQKTLRGYLDACAELIGPRQERIDEVFWRAAELRSRQRNGVRQAFRPSTVRTDLDLAGLDQRLAYFDELNRHAQEIGSAQEHVWSGFDCADYDASREDECGAILDRLHEAATTLIRYNEAASDRTGVTWSMGVTSVERAALAGLERLDTPDDLIQPLCKRLVDPEARRSIEQLVADLKRYADESAIAGQIPVRDPDAAEKAAGELAELLSVDLGRAIAELTYQDTHHRLGSLRAVRDALAKVREGVDALATVGLTDIVTVADYERACTCYTLLRDPTLDDRSQLRAELFYGSTRAVLARAEQQQQELESTRDALNEVFDIDDAPGAEEINTLQGTLRRFSRSRLRIFSGVYRDARKRVLTFLRPDARFDPGPISERLGELASWYFARSEFEGDRGITHALGPMFRGMDSDWNGIRRLVQLADELQDKGVQYEDAAAILEAVDSHSDAPTPEPLADHVQRLRRCIDDEDMATLLPGCSWLPDPEHGRLDEIHDQTASTASIIESMHNAGAAFSIDGRLPIRYIADVMSAIGESTKLRQRIERSDEYPALLGGLFKGVETPVAPILSTLEWRNGIAPLGLTTEVVAWLLEDDTPVRARVAYDTLEQSAEAVESWRGAATDLTQYGTLDHGWLAGGASGLGDAQLLAGRMETLRSSLAALTPWAGFCRAIERAETLGLSDFATAVRTGALSPGQASDAFELAFYEVLARDAINRHPALRHFTRQQHEEARRRFQELDEEIQVHHRREIAHRAAQREVPRGVQTGRVRDLTELGLISHEVKKERRHCRLRQLMNRAGDAVLGLKPCMMLSPLSVAQFLPPGAVEFDLVVMDEASQIRPEDALGAVIRAKQLVVVGDPKQLPPTSFWDRIGMNEVDEEEATIVDDTESILEVAMRAFPTVRRLRWHYRSQHECLIAFSNERFYDGDLIVFPSPTTEAGRLGLLHHEVQDGSFKKGRNLGEAKFVAEAIARHAVERGDQSLGVGTFNRPQAELIEECLDKLCRDDAHLRRAVERLQNRDDGLFVKNLENLQGDERDVIFIGYTYGPDPETKNVYQRFGPITYDNGWRRLNVLITRARQRVEVFSSMQPSDIQGGPDKSRGVNSMRDYLDFVRTGRIPQRRETGGGEPQSPFEVAVASVLGDMGLKVMPQVGVAGYYIDLGVLRPDSDNEFLLGIECDGATYHSARSVRDRDRLREQVIRRRGWELHRVWSTDWFQNQSAEEERLRKRVNELLGSAGE